MRVVMCQLNPQNDKVANLRQAFDAVAEASRGGADVVTLPEMFSFMGPDSERAAQADALGQGVFAGLQTAAALHRINLIGGSSGELPPADVLRDDIAFMNPNPRFIFNTNQCFDAEGRLVNTYRKVHLFRFVSEPDSGTPGFRESDWCLSGKPPQRCFEIVVGSHRWRALVLICFDLRFPEIFRLLGFRDAPPDVIFLPSAFTHRTGKAHWEVLLRARAIENQCYIVACNQTGTFASGSKRNFGHSMIVSPWGEVLLDMGEDVGVGRLELEIERVHKARGQLPALDSRVL